MPAIENPSRLRAIGYCRVSTTEQANSGAGIDAQRAALQAEADKRGWSLEFVVENGLSAKDLNRPALMSALNRLDKGQADGDCSGGWSRVVAG